MNHKLLAVIGILAMLLGNLPGSVFAAAPVSPDPDPSGPSTVYIPILFGPAPSKSSFELIEEALSAGELAAGGCRAISQRSSSAVSLRLMLSVR